MHRFPPPFLYSKLAPCSLVCIYNDSINLLPVAFHYNFNCLKSTLSLEFLYTLLQIKLVFCVQAFIAAPGGERGRVHAAETVRSVGLCRSLRVMEACPGQGHAPLSCGAGHPGARGGPSRSSSSVAVVTVPLSSSGWLRAEQGSRGTSRLPSRQPVKCVPTPHVCRRGRSE